MLRVSQNVFKINYLKKHLVKFIITQKVHSEIKALPFHEEGGCQEGPDQQAKVFPSLCLGDCGLS